MGWIHRGLEEGPRVGEREGEPAGLGGQAGAGPALPGGRLSWAWLALGALVRGGRLDGGGESFQQPYSKQNTL